MADVIEDVESKSQKMYQLMLVYRKFRSYILYSERFICGFGKLSCAVSKTIENRKINN